MAVREKDPVTGRYTTGHEWNGIKELDTRVPRVVIFFLVVTILFSVVYWILMPAWPTGTSYTAGLLGIDQHDSVERALERAETERADWQAELRSLDLPEVVQRPELMRIVREGGRSLFGDNCAVCHGTDGSGSPGYPDLASGAFVWGGEPDTILETIRVGINSAHPETRIAEMPGFRRDGVLNTQEVSAIVSFIRSNASDVGELSDRDESGVEEGHALFGENCASCHGEDARGMQEVGGPDLLDGNWIYGGDRATLFASIADGRRGHMPHWENRLSERELRMLALYVVDLSSRDEVVASHD